MERRHIIVLIKGQQVETWGSLKEICDVHELPYHSLKAKRFPFEYEGFTFHKPEYRTKLIN